MATLDITIQPNVNNSSVVLAEQQKLSEMSNVFSYEGNDVTMRLENGVVFVNLTEVAKAFPSKNLTQIINSKEIQEYATKLATKLQIYSLADLVRVTRGGDGSHGTWAHQRVALRVAQKLSTDFAIWVDEKIEELLTEGHTSIYQVPQSFADALMLAAQQQKRIEEQQKLLESQNIQIKSLETRTRYLDIILSSKNATPVRIIAQDYGMKADEFNTMLKGYDIQYKQSGTWVLKKPYLSGGYVKSVPIPIQHKSGYSEVKNHTQWTQKGRLFLYEFLKGKDILPLIERADLFKGGGQYAI